ncbi:MAG: Bax inhibitor-1 family protein, partial [Rubrivivax sp.]|nr:Bax inhibitor-1 family protein [Rubrivivax sp.]
MNPNVEVLQGGAVALDGERQRVLRNTYALLAVSMLPTILGAWIGVQTGLVSALSPMLSLIVFMVGAFGLMFLIEKNKNSGLGVALLLGFTFFMGLMLSRLLGVVLSRGNGASVVMMAFA